MTYYPEGIPEASSRLHGLFELLPYGRRQLANLYLSAAIEATLTEDSLVETSQTFMAVAFIIGFLATAPLGIAAGIVAYEAGLSHSAGLWLFGMSVVICGLSFGLGFLVGRGSPGKGLF